MPVSYQSWEMAGPPFTYNMAGRSNSCAVVDAPKGSTFSNFRVHDTFSRGFSNGAEAPKGSTYRISSPQDNVVRGLSTLSLRGQSQAEADFTPEESGSVPLGALCCASPEVYRCMSPRSNESLPFALAPPSAGRKPLGSYGLACNVGFVSSSEECSQVLAPHILENASFSNTSGSSNFTSSAERKVTQPREYDLESDTISESSLSLGNDIPLASSSSSGDASQLSDDTEAQSAFKEAADLSSSLDTSSFSRKGLSRFYAGKSRSFSCLSDAVSVKDLAKPESPYAKKRRVNVSGARLPPLQKSAASISKKQIHSGKSTLALAVAMSTKEEHESQASLPPRCQKSLVPSRSYSLPDLQGAAGSLFFIG
eukprot:c10924_g1_i1 orf=446-1546(-)